MMRQLGETLGISLHVFGPEMHVTGIVPMALKGVGKEKYTGIGTSGSTGNLFYDQMGVNVPNGTQSSSPTTPVQTTPPSPATAPLVFPTSPSTQHPWYTPFTNTSRSFIYGMQPRAVQGMLDFDYMCNRPVPSVAAMIYPFGGHHVQKFYWGTQETLLPVFTSVAEAVERFVEVDTVVNFASCRSYVPLPI